MKCKVFNCKVEDLENKVSQWFVETKGLYILNVTLLGVSEGNTGVLIFYKDLIKVVQPDVPDGELPKCPKCERVMRVRANSTNGELFFGCTAYPECKGTKQFTTEDEIRFGGALSLTDPPQDPSPDESIPF